MWLSFKIQDMFSYSCNGNPVDLIFEKNNKIQIWESFFLILFLAYRSFNLFI
jgi:hypothetical protein